MDLLPGDVLPLKENVDTKEKIREELNNSAVVEDLRVIVENITIKGEMEDIGLNAAIDDFIKKTENKRLISIRRKIFIYISLFSSASVLSSGIIILLIAILEKINKRV